VSVLGNKLVTLTEMKTEVINILHKTHISIEEKGGLLLLVEESDISLSNTIFKLTLTKANA